MSKERPKSPRARMFVALDLPDRVRAGVAGWGEKALADPALRPVPERSLHVTLAFLGWTPEKAVGEIERILRKSALTGPRMRLGDPVPRPDRGAPRLFALPVDSEEAVAMQSGLERGLVAARLYEPEKRPFWPHVTLARVRHAERGARRPATVERPPGPLPEGLLRPFRGVRLTLYRSQLQPQGAQYTPLAQVELPGGRQ